MGRRSTTGGVTPARDRIQLYFRFQNQKCRPTLAMKPTPANMTYARRLVRDIEEKIRHGTFNLAAEFPDYKGLERFGASHLVVKTLGEYITAWETTNSQLSPSTLDGYSKIFNRHWRDWFGSRPINTILPSEIGEKMGSLAISRKTYNNVLNCGRVVFALALADKIIAENPVAHTGFLKLQQPEPDPFDLAEIDLILPRLAERWGADVADYYEFAFFSGLRPNEQIELHWTDMDLIQRTARISRGKVRKTVKDTKTYNARTVELHARAWAVIERQQARTRLAGKHVFLNPNTGQPWASEHAQSKMFNAVIKALGIRHRPAKNTRHSYATTLLMAGVNPAWAARQLGHSRAVFDRIYAKWINSQDGGRELAKAEAYTAPGSIPNPGIERTGSA